MMMNSLTNQSHFVIHQIIEGLLIPFILVLLFQMNDFLTQFASPTNDDVKNQCKRTDSFHRYCFIITRTPALNSEIKSINLFYRFFESHYAQCLPIFSFSVQLVDFAYRQHFVSDLTLSHLSDHLR
jgi:hypothetical protein